MKTALCLMIVALAFLIVDADPATADRPELLTGAFDPEEVLTSLEQAVAARDWKRFGDFLAEDFRFIPFSAVYQEYPQMDWDLWNRAREIKFIEELVSPNHRAALALLEKVLDRGSESRDRAEWDLIYTLKTRERVFRSRAIFVFAKVDSRWYLREWIDTTIETDQEHQTAFETSGSLRGVLSR